MKAAAVIPCRYASTRFEGKPLALIGDKPMMWHVYQQALKAASISEVHIATDDERIASVCRELGMNFIMTEVGHLTGTDRVAECARKLDVDVIVNIQGDEPFILPESVDAVASALLNTKLDGVAASNGCTRITGTDDVGDDGVVKVVFSQSGQAMSYSRLPVPLSFRSPAEHFRQLGLYAFRKDALEFFSRTTQGPLEASESVEMFRFIEHDKAVLMVEVEESGIAVDTPGDLAKAISHYQSQA